MLLSTYCCFVFVAGSLFTFSDLHTRYKNELLLVNVTSIVMDNQYYVKLLFIC